MGRGLTYPDRRIQVGHSHLLRTLHGLDHLLLVLRGESVSAPAMPQPLRRAGLWQDRFFKGMGQSQTSPAQPKTQDLSRDTPCAPKELGTSSQGRGLPPTS